MEETEDCIKTVGIHIGRQADRQACLQGGRKTDKQAGIYVGRQSGM